MHLTSTRNRLEPIARPWIERPLALLLILGAVCWCPYFAGDVVPFHDSAAIYQGFHSFYSQALFRGELARWIPYGNYGMQADLSQASMHPTAVAVGLLGLVFKVRNTLVLAKIAMLLNEALYGFGLYLLGSEIYSRRMTRFLISLAGVLSISWMQEFFINVSVFYLFPLVLYFIIRFFKTQNVACLFVAGLIEICSFIGGVPYFAPLHALMLLIICIPLCRQYPPAVKSLLRPRHLAHPGLWIMAAVGLVVAGFVAGGLDGLALLSPDRDPTTGKVSKSVFLNYGRLPVATTLFGFVTGGIPHADNTYYVGLLALAMFAFALATVDDSAFVGMASACFVLCWLSVGGVFARLVYYFPGMNVFRHIGLVFGLTGSLLLICSGFGLDRLFERFSAQQPPSLAHPRRRWGFLAVAAVFAIVDFVITHRPDDFHVEFAHPEWKPFFVFRVLMYAAAVALLIAVPRVRRPWNAGSRVPAWIVAAAFLLDLASFRAQVCWTIPRVPPADLVAGVFSADPLPWLEQRGAAPQGTLPHDRLRVFDRIIPPFYNVEYMTLQAFARVDTCRPEFRTDFIRQVVLDMIHVRGGEPTSFPLDTYLPAQDHAFKTSLGCGAPRVRLVWNTLLAGTDGEAKALFAAVADPASTVVLLSGDPRDASAAGQEQHDPPGTVHVTEFSANRILMQVDVPGAHPAWLVYADAWHPSWKARIDRREAPVLRANLGHKAVRVEPGAHDVEFVFDPRPRTWLAWCHLAITASFGFMVCGAMFVAATRKVA
ncbi:MAG: hypothetical protein HY290_04100 [Planctomycetia bacterium]|nr:hypothetical protein [Planctomycetia bacterium]